MKRYEIQAQVEKKTRSSVVVDGEYRCRRKVFVVTAVRSGCENFVTQKCVCVCDADPEAIYLYSNFWFCIRPLFLPVNNSW